MSVYWYKNIKLLSFQSDSPSIRIHVCFLGTLHSMEKNILLGEQRCGHYDEDQLPHGGPARERRDEDSIERYNREDPSIGVQQLTTGYRKWAERYLSQCSGQKKFSYQIDRMNKWNEKLQGHLAAYEGTKPVTVTTTSQQSEYCNL